MATIKVNVSLEFEIESGGVVTNEASAENFVSESLGAIADYFDEQVKSPSYLGPKVRIRVPQNAVSAVASE